MMSVEASEPFIIRPRDEDGQKAVSGIMTDSSDNMTKQELEAQIHLCAREKVQQMRLVSDMTEKRISLRIEIDRIESMLNIAEEKCERLEKEGMELTRRLMDMKEEAECEKGD
jgi:hypothetical protein